MALWPFWLPCPSQSSNRSWQVPQRSIGSAGLAPRAAALISLREGPSTSDVIADLLQFFCTRCPCQPNATTMRTTAGTSVNPRKIPENYVIPISVQRETDGRRAGLKIRSWQEGVGSSPTFGTKASSPPNSRKGRGTGRTAVQGGVPRMVPLESRIHRSIPDDDGWLTSALRGRSAIDA